MLKLRQEEGLNRYAVHSGVVRVGTIYKASGRPSRADAWFWGFHGIHKGPVHFSGYAPTLETATAEFMTSWLAWLEAVGLTEREPTESLG